MLWLLLVILLFCSAVISGSETALFGLSRRAMQELRQAQRPMRRRVYTLMQSPRWVLMTVLMANTAINVAIFSVSFFALSQIRGTSTLGAAIGALLVPLAVVVFGEMLPKAAALSNPRRFAPPAAGLVGAMQILFGPVQWVLATLLIDPLTRLLAPATTPGDAVSTDELRLLVEHTARDGAIDSAENEMLQAIIALGDATVRDVMTPRVDIVSILTGAKRGEAERVIRASNRRRIPVCERDLDDIHGILYARDLYLQPDQPITSLTRDVHFVPEQLTLMQLLRQFRTERIHMAIVVDEYGGTAGLVTIEDVMEWIVGDLPDAESPLPAIPSQQLDENTYRLAGDLSVRLWADRFSVGEIEGYVDTLAGLILARIGRVPKVGDSIRIRNLTLTVDVMRGHRIDRVVLRHDPNGAAVEESTP